MVVAVLVVLVVLEEAYEAAPVEVRLDPHGLSVGPGLNIGECEAPILGLDRLLIDGLLERLYAGGGLLSCGGLGCVEGRRPTLGAGADTVGILSLLAPLRPGMTLFLMPRPVSVAPWSGNLMGWWMALPPFSSSNPVSISFRNDVKLDSHTGTTSSSSGGGSG